jgi:hypothetical protein
LTVFQFSWEEIYMAALMETDSSRLPELLNVAAGTLLDRRLALTASRGNEIEVGAVEDALGRWPSSNESTIPHPGRRKRRPPGPRKPSNGFADQISTQIHSIPGAPVGN